MSLHFDRRWKVTAYRSDAVNFSSQQETLLEITELRVQAKIEKQLSEEPNTCEVSITNCAPQTRADLQRKPLKIRVDAGYDGAIRHLFSGDLKHGYSLQDDTEWVTVMQLGDGERAYAHARVSKSFRPGSRALDVVRECARSMNLPLDPAVSSSPELAAPLPKGFALAGVTREQLTQVLAEYGYSWSIQDGRLQVLRSGATQPGTELELSQETGMIGSPELAAPSKPGQSPTLSLKTLLYPELVPGSRVRVVSRSIRGPFRVQRVVHSLDSHGDEWFTEIEAKPV